MADNDLDFKDILMEVEAEVTTLFEDVMTELQFPAMKQALRVRWMTMPDDLKEQVKDEHPEIYEQIIRMVNEDKPY